MELNLKIHNLKNKVFSKMELKLHLKMLKIIFFKHYSRNLILLSKERVLNYLLRPTF